MMRLIGIVFLVSSALADGPMATIKSKNHEVDRLLRIKAEKGSAEEKKVKEDIKQTAATLLDYEDLAKRALADRWDKITPAQRSEFVTVFRQLLERRYVKQIRTNLDYKVIYQDEQMEKNGEATVNTVVKVKTAGAPTDAEVVYKLHKTTPGWMIHDVITDDSSLLDNYKSQFKKIIDEKGYDDLVRRLKKKLAEEV
jgi:phospholipid transport system substrate-binding protein